MTEASLPLRFSGHRLGIAVKIGAGLGVLVALSVFVAVSVLVYLIEFRDSVDDLTQGSLPRIILFADMERSLEDILYTAEELSRAIDPRVQRNLSEEIEAQLGRITTILQGPELATQRDELGALNDAITTSLQSLDDAVGARIELRRQMNLHLQGMRQLRRLSFDGVLPLQVTDMVNDLEEAVALEDRYQLRMAQQEIGQRYRPLVRGLGPPRPGAGGGAVTCRRIARPHGT